MSAYRFRRFGRRAAERLLRGEPAAHDRALHDLLTAAAAPARDDELDRENAAVVAFRTARLQPVPQPRRRSMIKTTLAKLLTTKIAAAAAAAAVVTAGGVAAVAATGNLPSPRGGSTNVETTTSATPSATADPTREGLPTRSESREGHDSSPSPSLEGLCQAYTAGAGSEHGKALDSPAFTVLINTAGGKDNVDAYCTALLAKPHGDQNQTHAANPSTPSAANHSTEAHNPEAPGSTHPTGAPSTHPSH